MKRYKVLAPVTVWKGDKLIGYIPTDTRICLEEVKEEKEKAIPIYCPDCGGYLSYVHDCKKDQPKKEKEFNAEVMVEPKEGERCNCRACHKDQPLTPKDVEHKPHHRMYCGKSGMRCLVYHADGICPDVRDCDACKLERN